MDREDRRVVATAGGEDRLSALMAGVLLAAHLAGGGLLVVLKALDVPPLVASPEPAGPATFARVDPEYPSLGDRAYRVAAPGVARVDPSGRLGWRR